MQIFLRSCVCVCVKNLLIREFTGCAITNRTALKKMLSNFGWRWSRSIRNCTLMCVPNCANFMARIWSRPTEWSRRIYSVRSETINGNEKKNKINQLKKKTDKFAVKTINQLIELFAYWSLIRKYVGSDLGSHLLHLHSISRPQFHWRHQPDDRAGIKFVNKVI